jgi:DNA-binding SARP family transcriptional activator
MGGGAPPDNVVEVRILGSLEIRSRGTALVPRRRLTRVLLGALALRPNTPATLEWIVDALWNGTPPRSAAANVRSHIADLRRLLGPNTGEPRIETAGGRYALLTGPAGLDALRFDAHLAAGRHALATARPELAAEQLRLACGLWRGPLLEGTTIASTVVSTAASLEGRRLDALEAYVEARLALGEHAALASELAGLTAAYGLREELWRQRMRALWQCGRPAEALAAYQQLAQLLDGELGAVPSGSTRTLYERIQRGEPGPHEHARSPVPEPPRTTPAHADLDFDSPLSDARAARIIRTLQPLHGARVVDVGCGWAELLLRIVAAEPSATAIGIDTDEAAIARGRANAAGRGLGRRVELHVADAKRWGTRGADVAICVGASHAWGGTAAALDALRETVRPGGRVLLGEGFWQRTPTGAALAALGGDPDNFRSLPQLVDLAVAHGLRPLDVAQASIDEWDAFESGHALGRERWLLANPDDPEAGRIRAEADEQRERWLHGYRGVLGFAYLTLVRPAER